MCKKCQEFDEKIAHYRRIEANMTDELTLKGIKQLIGEATAGKAALHPERKT